MSHPATMFVLREHGPVMINVADYDGTEVQCDEAGQLLGAAPANTGGLTAASMPELDLVGAPAAPVAAPVAPLAPVAPEPAPVAPAPAPLPPVAPVEPAKPLGFVMKVGKVFKITNEAGAQVPGTTEYKSLEAANEALAAM